MAPRHAGGRAAHPAASTNNVASSTIPPAAEKAEVPLLDQVLLKNPASNRGWATLAELTLATGQSREELLGQLAELSAEGVMRLSFEPVREIPGIRVAGRLDMIDDNEDVCSALILEPPWAPLSEQGRQCLDVYLQHDAGNLTLGKITLICASVRVARSSADGDALTFTSDEIEDHLGMRRGSMR